MEHQSISSPHVHPPIYYSPVNTNPVQDLSANNLINRTFSAIKDKASTVFTGVNSWFQPTDPEQILKKIQSLEKQHRLELEAFEKLRQSCILKAAQVCSYNQMAFEKMFYIWNKITVFQTHVCEALQTKFILKANQTEVEISDELKASLHDLQNETAKALENLKDYSESSPTTYVEFKNALLQLSQSTFAYEENQFQAFIQSLKLFEQELKRHIWAVQVPDPEPFLKGIKHMRNQFYEQLFETLFKLNNAELQLRDQPTLAKSVIKTLFNVFRKESPFPLLANSIQNWHQEYLLCAAKADEFGLSYFKEKQAMQEKLQEAAITRKQIANLQQRLNPTLSLPSPSCPALEET